MPNTAFSRVAHLSPQTSLTLLLATLLFGLSCSSERKESPPAHQNAQVAAAPLVEQPIPDCQAPELADSLIRAASQIRGTHERIEFFAQALLGSPYDATGPTGEGPDMLPDTAPLYNFRAYDCVTYLEHVLALSRSAEPCDFLPQLIALRYKNGVVSYTNRNHYFVADWMQSNTSMLTLLEPPAPVRVVRTVNRTAFFMRAGIAITIPDTTLELKLWSAAELARLAHNEELPAGAFLAVFVKKGWRNIDANHAGLVLIQSPGTPRFFQASGLRKQTVVQDFGQYLERQNPFLDGVILAKIDLSFAPEKNL